MKQNVMINRGVNGPTWRRRGPSKYSSNAVEFSTRPLKYHLYVYLYSVVEIFLL